jgi:hypothetical protein
MTQTPATKPAGGIGAQAAAAATNNAKPADKPVDKPADKPTEAAKSDDKTAGAGTASSNAEGDADKKNRNPNKTFIVVGQIHEFETPAKAEKFLNGEGAPTEYAVLKGKRVGTKKRVSLR